MTDPVTYEITSDDKGEIRQLESVMLDLLGRGKVKLFAVGADGSREELHISEATHSRGHSEFHPTDARHDKHGPHRAGHRHDGTVRVTIASVAGPSSAARGGETA